MRFANTLTVAGLIGGLLLLTGAPAFALTWFPDCHSGAVTAKIRDKFNWADHHTWYRGITMVAIDREHERWTEYFGPYPISRRYCRGTGYLSNGKRIQVYYLIEQGMWVAGTAWNVEYCVPGHDRWHVYGGACRVLRR